MSATTSYFDQNGENADLEKGLKDSKVLDKIASMLSGSEWNSDTMEEIVEIIRSTGRSVEDVS